MAAGESDAPQGVVNTSDGRVVRAFHRFTLVDQTGQGRDLTKGRRRDQVNEQVLPSPTFLAYLCLSAYRHFYYLPVCICLSASACQPWPVSIRLPAFACQHLPASVRLYASITLSVCVILGRHSSFGCLWSTVQWCLQLMEGSHTMAALRHLQDFMCKRHRCTNKLVPATCPP